MDFVKKINEFGQKVGETASETYKTVADKSSKLIEEGKLRSEVSDKQEELEKEYKFIGESIYNMYCDGKDVDNTFAKNYKKIEKLKSDIEDLKTKILYNKDLRKCPNCGGTIKLDSEYCQNCGQKQKKLKIKLDKNEKDDSDKKEEKQPKVCPQCGNLCDPDAKFCPKCGYKF